MKNLVPTIIFLCLANILSAQYFYYNDEYYDKDLLFEGGLSVGIMNAGTDVGAKKGSWLSPGYYNLGASGLSFGVYAAASYKNTYGARLEFTHGTISGYDSKSNSAFIRRRNLTYKTTISEVALTGSIYPLEFLNTEYAPVISPYAMVGIGIFFFYPKGLYKGEWVPLSPLHTEGQNSRFYPRRKQYSLTSISFPVGFGLKYEYSPKITFRVEGLYRLTGTDYLDDVSRKYANPKSFKGNVRDEWLPRALYFAQAYKELNPQENLVGTQRGSARGADRFFTITVKAGWVIGRTKIPINDVP